MNTHENRGDLSRPNYVGSYTTRRDTTSAPTLIR
jgi:hypothetical protein